MWHLGSISCTCVCYYCTPIRKHTGIQWHIIKTTDKSKGFALLFWYAVYVCLAVLYMYFSIRFLLWVILPLIYFLWLHANGWEECSIPSAKVLVGVIKWFYRHFISGSLRRNDMFLSVHITKWHIDGVKLVQYCLALTTPVLWHCLPAENNKKNITFCAQLYIQWVLNKLWKLGHKVLNQKLHQLSYDQSKFHAFPLYFAPYT